MLTLIAESKTMTSREQEICPEEYRDHTPLFEKEADSIVKYLSAFDTIQISKSISISPALAMKAAHMFYEFPNKSTGCSALKAFTGEVFRGIDIPSLGEEALKYSNNHVLIISSLYGLLNPQDIIKPYRLDFNADCSPDGGKLSKFWKSKLTIAFVKHLKNIGETEVLDLLPGEAAKCLDWKIIKAFAKVMKADFKTIGDEGNLKTPHSGKLKELRGKMVRTILDQKINDFNTLLKLKTPDFAADPDLYKPGLPTYIALK